MTGIESLIDDFIARVRRGERPDPEEYAARHPDLAADIRDLFPALAALEEAGATGPQAPPGAPPPRQLGEYLILREVGRGGMGVVYEAVQESLGRHVALKVLVPGLHTRPTHVERFRREARAAAGLHHTNIVPVFGVGEQDGAHYYAMQFIRGQTLSAVVAELRDRPASPTASTLVAGPASGASALVPGFYKNVARLIAQAADALEHAHRHGLVHRDIKPSNLLLDHAGTVWVSDFGLAKAADGEALTETGDVLGTLSYMAPEQLDGKADARTDVYALGLTLYELATLTPAFREDARGRLIELVRRGNPPAPRTIDPRLPRDLETIVRKATTPDPAHRYRTAGELADDLRRFADGRTILARRATWPAQTWRWARRNPMVAGLTGGIAMLLLMATAGSVVAVVSYQGQRDRAVEAAWRAQLAEARAVALSGHPGRRFRALHLLKDAIVSARRTGLTPDDEREFRSVAAAVLVLTDLDSPGAESTAPIETRSSSTGEVRVVLRADGTELGRVAGAGERSRVALTPNGRRVAVARSGPGADLVILDVTADGLSEVARLPGAHVRTPVLSPDGRRVAGQTDWNAVRVWDVETGADWMLPVGEGPREPVPLAFAADGRLAYPVFTRGRYGVWVWRDGQSMVIDGPAGDGPVRALEWDAAGRWLAVADETRVLRVWDIVGGWEVGPGLNHPARGVRGRFTDRPDRLMTLDGTDQFRVWEVPTGRLLVNVPNPRPGRFPGLADAGPVAETGYAAGSELVRAIRLGRDELFAVGARGVCFSPVDGLIAAGYMPDQNVIETSGVALLDPATGMPAAVIDGLPMHPTGFQSDGSLVTSGYYGVLHWPRSEGAGEVTFGPPGQWYRRPASDRDAVVAAAGLAAFVRDSQLRLVGPGRPEVQWEHGFRSIEQVALSPDNLWGAVVGDPPVPGPRLRVFDPAGPTTAFTAEMGPPTGVGFSPDGRWLWASDGKARVWRTGSWEPGPVVGGRRVAISPDGTVAAADDGNGRVRFIRLDGPEAGAEIVTLTISDREPLVPIAYSPDGTRFAAYAVETRLLLVWDLTRLRAGLAGLGLDWEPTGPPRLDPPARRYRIDHGRYEATNRAFRHLTRGEHAAAVEIYQAARRANPMDMVSRRQLSELYLFGPPSVRDPAAADGPTAEMMAAIGSPDAWTATSSRSTYLTMRAAFEYHRGDYEAALALLDRTNQESVKTSVLYPLVRGLTLRALGRLDEARPYLTKSEDQMDWLPSGYLWHRTMIRDYWRAEVGGRRP